MAILWFAAGSLLTFVMASGLSVFLSGQLQHAGGGGSLQVLCVLSLVATLLLMVGFGLGAAVARRFPARALATGLGVACALVFIAALGVATALQANPAESWGLVLALPFIGALSSLWRRRGGSRPY